MNSSPKIRRSSSTTGYRRDPRVAVSIPVEFTPWDPKHMAFGFATNLSRGGVYIRAVFTQPTGQPIALRIWAQWPVEEHVVAGRVCWEDRGGMGVQFESCDARTLLAIEELMGLASRSDQSLPAYLTPRCY